MNQKQYKKILVIKQGSLGDIIFALPAMYSIRFYFEHSKITLLTETRFANFLKKSQYFDHFLIDNRKGWVTDIDFSDAFLHYMVSIIVKISNENQ